MKDVYFDKIRKEVQKPTYLKKDFFNDDYLISSEKNIEIFYAPFDYINSKASVVIVGITPGKSQTEKAFEAVINKLRKGKSDEYALKAAKSAASFAGPMRSNLINMLDELQLNKKLNLNSTSELFNIDNDLLHSTSALRYPVFVNGKNYTGSNPASVKNKFLWQFIDDYLVPEMSQLSNTLVIPLGKSVNDIFLKLENDNTLNHNFILTGFPHPSGANAAHMKRQFEANKAEMLDKIEQWHLSLKPPLA